jgi:nitric oxide reductase large subunit
MRGAAVFVATAAVLVLVLALAGHLPDPVVSHFGSTGRPDATVARHWLVFFMATLVTLVPTLTWWAVTRAAALGKANIPNASYWFSPGRREQTQRYIGGHAAFLGVLLAAFLGYNFCLLVLANAHGATEARLDMPLFLGGLLLFLAVTVGSVIAIVRRFSLSGREPR